MSELQNSVEYLVKQNESLEHQNTQLSRDLKDRDEEYDVEMQQERAHERRRQRWENSMGPPDDRPPQK